MALATTIDELEQDILRDEKAGVQEAEKQVRVTLSKDTQQALALSWHTGFPGGLSRYSIEPGASLVVPMHRAQAWFGPFFVLDEFAATTDEGRRDRLRLFYKEEKARYLNRYDYPRGDGRGYKPDMTPSGPHRSPDVTVTIIDADGGVEHEPIRLHEAYKVGEWDPLKDTFGPKETLDEAESRHAAALSDRDREVRELRLQIERLAGITSGFIAGAEIKAQEAK